MARYAEKTSVPTSASREEIDRTVHRYGATSFLYAAERGRAVVQFIMKGKLIRFELPLPDRNHRDFTHTPGKGLERSSEAALEAWEQACRQRWRALALAIKAKLEAVEAGITTFETEFLAHIVLYDGRTVGEHAIPKLEEALKGGTPRLLPAAPVGEVLHE